MKMTYKLRDYQQDALNFALDCLYIRNEPGEAMLKDPGLGKTLTTLALIKRLRSLGEVKRTLVIAPLNPLYDTWPNEIEKHGFDFTWEIVHGTRKQRWQALRKKVDIHFMNPDGVRWLVKVINKGFWDLLVVDESTAFKNFKAQRTKDLHTLSQNITRRINLTGTPRPKGMVDLPAQIKILDGGQRLGKSMTEFAGRFGCHPGGFKGYGWKVPRERQDDITEAISDICYRADAKDHLDMPDFLEVDDVIPFERINKKAYRQYRTMEEELFVLLEEGEDLTASNAGAKYQYCRSIANGGIYLKEEVLNSKGDYIKKKVGTEHIHKIKVDRIAEIIDEYQGEPAIIPYLWDHDRERLLKKFPKASVIDGSTSGRSGMKKRQAIFKKWNAEKVPQLLVQCQALSHGANLQFGGRLVIWCGLTDNLEVYDQLNARLYRSGQTRSVHVHRVIMKGTIEEAILARITEKAEGQKSMLQYLKRLGR